MKPLELQIASWKDDDGPHNISAADYREMAARKDTHAIAGFMGKSWSFNNIMPPHLHQPELANYPTDARIHLFRLCQSLASIELHRNGWLHREKTKANVFVSFFEAEPSFSGFKGYEREFYKHVARPILYWGHPITGGWQLTDGGNELFNPQTLTVDVIAFASALEVALEKYISELKSAQWQDEIWRNFRRKMNYEFVYWGFGNPENE